MQYNPIVRNFGKVRRVLVETLGLPRHAVRLSSKLAELVPREHRARVWQRFHNDVIAVQGLMITERQFWLCVLASLVFAVTGCFLGLNGWVCSLASIALFVLTLRLARTHANDINPDYTIADLVLEMTTPQECEASGYRYTRNEVFLKVRRIVSVVKGVAPSEITGETKLADPTDC